MVIAHLRHWIAFLWLLFLPAIALNAQELRFSHLSGGEEFSQGTVTALAQDKHGFLWIGTEDGLLRYDGNTVTVYRSDPDDSTTIQDNVITALAYDSSNRLWVASESDGVRYYDYASNEFKSIDDALIGTSIKNLYATPEQESIVVKSGTGLYRIDSDNGVTQLLDPNDSGLVIFASVTPELSRAVLYTGEAITISSSLEKTRQPLIENTSIIKAWSLTSCPLLFQGSSNINGTQLYCNDGDETKISPIQTILTDAGIDLSNIGISEIVEQNNGLVWLSTNAGLIKIDNNKVTRSYHLPYDEHSLSSNKLTALLASANTLFIGSEYDGLNIHQAGTTKFEYFNLLNSGTQWEQNINPVTQNETCGPAPAVDYDTVWSIMEASNGDLWVGNDYGMAIQRHGSKTFEDSSRLGSDETFIDLCSVWSLEETDEHVWIGIWGGLIALDKLSGEFVQYKSANETDNPNALSGKFIRLLQYDKARNTLWIGTNSQGLNRMDLQTRRITRYPFSADNPDQLPHGRIRSLYLDPDNRLWVGSGGGLSLWDEASDTFKTLGASSAATDLSDEDVRSINHHEGDYFWIGTGNGINLFNAKEFAVETRLNEKDGLSNSTVYAMVPDDKGRYWISTANGLNEFDPDAVSFKHYSYHDGLQSNEFNFNAWYKGTDGTLFFGGVSGLNVVHTEDATSEQPSTNPILISVVGIGSDGNKRVLSRFPEAEDESLIPKLYRQIVFNYSYPTLNSSKRLHSQHGLSRSGGNWSALTDAAGQPVYTNVAAGKHIFQLRSSQDENRIFEHLIYAEPYLTERWWFRLLLLAAALFMLAYAAIYYSKKRLRDSLDLQVRQHYYILEHELRPHLYQAQVNLTHLVESPAINRQDYAKTSIIPLIEKSLGFLTNVRHIIDFDQAATLPKSTYMLEDIVDEVMLYLKDEHKRVRILELEDINISTHENALYLLLTNLISNALKYSSDDVTVKITSQMSDLIVECADTGPGINQRQLDIIYLPYTRLPQKNKAIEGLGLGLTIVKSIIHTYKGSIKVEGNAPTGSRFFVRLKNVVTDDQ